MGVFNRIMSAVEELGKLIREIEGAEQRFPRLEKLLVALSSENSLSKSYLWNAV